MRRNRHAKIVATVGPASRSPDALKRLFEAGVDVFRLNFSHGSHQDHAVVYAAIRALEAASGRPIGILQDLQGPKIRIGTVRNDEILITRGSTVRFVPEGTGGGSDAIPLPHEEVFAAVAVGHRLMLDDGRLLLHVTGCSSDFIDAYVEVGGPLSNRKGVNFPDTPLEVSPLTDKDREDLAFALDLGVDWVALSF
ncbi:MAG: pyruvate kinase, partial [Hyphomicrobiales bacterium]|nr:pyruvate kinase [Hyphomicrobiales bacterium]